MPPLIYKAKVFDAVAGRRDVCTVVFFRKNIFWQTANIFTAKGYIEYGAVWELELL